MAGYRDQREHVPASAVRGVDRRGRGRLARPAQHDLLGQRSRNQAPERGLQISVVRWLRDERAAGRMLPEVDIGATLSEAVGKAGAAAKLTPQQVKAIRGILIRMGLPAGWPDVIVTAPPDVIVTAPRPVGLTFVGGLELKARGGSLSDAQRMTHSRLAACGWRIAVARSLEEAESVVRAWPIWR